MEIKRGENSKKRVLFVCLGNICRSPSAEAIFKSKVFERGLKDIYEIDSAGLHGYHRGEPADSRMIKHASARGYRLTSISRPVNYEDLDFFDYIVAMDSDNYEALINMASRGNYRKKILRMTDFCTKDHPGYVPDPYYGGSQGFEKVLDILEDASEGLLEQLNRD